MKFKSNRFAMMTIMALSTFFWSGASQAQVWVDHNNWSTEWEARYSRWVKDHWHTKIFSQRKRSDGSANPYFGLRADCADTVYSMRIIFAAENALPFAFLDPTSGTRVITNRMTRFNEIPEGERVKRFLNYTFNILSTASLPNDSYPTALQRRAIRPGTFILTTRQNHHSWTLKDISPTGIPWLVFNSRIGAGSGSELQQRQSWPNPHWIFEGNATAAGHAGFRDWRPQQYLGRPVWEVPGYSEEQYQIPVAQWATTAQNRLATQRETDEQLIGRLINNACEEVTARVQSIREGVEFLARQGDQCMSYETYDIYSTPSRDRRTFDAIAAIRVASRRILAENGGVQLSAQTRRQLHKMFPQVLESAHVEATHMLPQEVTADSVCVIDYGRGRVDLAEIKRRFFIGRMSNNPHDGLIYRWGERMGPSPLGQRCQAWDHWSPDLNTAN